jgi:vitamin B12 transporter
MRYCLQTSERAPLMSDLGVDGIAAFRQNFPAFSRKYSWKPGLSSILFRFCFLIALVQQACLFTQQFAWSQAPAPSAELRHVTGSVVDQSGSAVPRALVQAHDAEDRVVASGITNGRGEFTFDLKEGKYRVSASMAGFAPLQNHTIAVTESTPPLTMILEISSLDQQIIVTATKTETPLAQVGSSVTVMSGEELAQEGIASVGEGLRRVAGAGVVQSGGIGQVTSLFIRGGNSNYTKVLIDGIAVNEPGGIYNFANMSATAIDRIEIVRGAQSTLFGSDAIAGVVQIFTKRGTSEGLSPRPSIFVEGGTFNTYRYGVGLEGKGNRVDYALSFSRFDTDNNVLNGSFNDATISGNLGIRPSEKTEIRAIFRSEAGRAGVPGAWAFQRPDPDAFYRRMDEAGALTFTYNPTISWTQKFSYSVSDSQQFSANPKDSGSYVPQYQGRMAPFAFSDSVYQTLNDTRRQKISYQSDLALALGHLFTVGADYEHESGMVGDPQSNPLEAKRDNYGGYLQDQWSLHNRLFAVAGIRLEHNDSFGFFAAPRLSWTFLVNQPSSGAFWGLTKLKANFGVGIKEPSLVQSFSNSPFFQGNPNLRPEKALSFDAGFEQTLYSGQTVVEATYFENHFRNQIEYIVTNPQTYAGTFFNLGKARARGLEVMLRQKLISNLELSGSYTLLDSIILESSNSSDAVYAEGQELLRRPRHSGFVDLRWKPGRWTLGASGIFVGSRADSDFSYMGFTRNKGYSILNLLANFKLAGGVSVFASVNNALNESYMEVLGYPALRANFRIGLRAGL